MSHIVRVSEVDNYMREGVSSVFRGFFVNAIYPDSYPRAKRGYVAFGTIDADANGNYVKSASRATLPGTYYLGYTGKFPAKGQLVLFHENGQRWTSPVNGPNDLTHRLGEIMTVTLGPRGTGAGQFDLDNRTRWPLKIIAEV